MWDEDAEEPDAEGELATEGEVSCPWCGETNAVALDPGGGMEQEYVEDCQVCCRPWVVHVRFDDGGAAEIWVEAADE